MQKTLLFFVTAVAVMIGGAHTASATESSEPIWRSTNNCLVSESSSENPSCWVKMSGINYGDVSVDNSTEITTLASTPNASAYSFTDVNIDADTDQYMIMISYSKAEEIVAPDNITGLPYLYGYQMTDSSYIAEYMQGQKMLFDGEEGQWNLNYGVYPVETTDVSQVRYFMMQALEKGTDYNGSDASFVGPGLYIVNSEEEAQQIVDQYEEDADHIGEVVNTDDTSGDTTDDTAEGDDPNLPERPWKNTLNCLNNESAADNENCWVENGQQFFGNASYNKEDEITTVASEADSPSHSSLDVDVNAAEGQYLLMVGFTQAEKVRENGNITGLPYFYGYQMDASGTISDYMQGQTVVDAQEAEWDMSYGLYPVSAGGIQQVRFFMMQGLQNGSEYDGSDAYFKQPGLFIVNSREEANALVANYEEATHAQLVERLKKHVNKNSVKLRWRGQVNAEHYTVKLKRKVEGEQKVLKTVKVEDKHSVKITKLKPETTYRVMVRAVVNGEKSGWVKRTVRTAGQE